MSQEETVSRKAKKVQRDADRQKKGSKRQRAEADDDAQNSSKPVLEDLESAEQDVREKNVNKSKTSRKRKSRDADSREAVEGAVLVESEPNPKKRKKGTTDATEDVDTVPQQPTKSRFIVFVGNLPYTTTDESLKKHFSKLEPFNLRHRTDPKTKKSKGFAFLEFENYDRMKTCLKLYHHGMFDPADPTAGESDPNAEATVTTNSKRKKSSARRINVELTAGGGGKTEGRQAKIKAKNVRLDEQRQRRAEAERKEKIRKERKEGGKNKTHAVAEDENKQANVIEENPDIHPSRLARING